MRNLWQRFRCATGSHRLHVIAHVSPASDHVACSACGRQFGMNHDVRAFLPWSDVAGFHREAHGYDSDARFAAWKERNHDRP